MQTTAVQTIATVLPALATLQVGSVRHAQLGRKLRIYRPETVKALKLGTEQEKAIHALVLADLKVRVYSGGTIYTPSLTADGALKWTAKAARKFRTSMTVEVVL